MNSEEQKTKLRHLIRKNSLLQGKAFTLASGETSQYYFNMKNCGE